MLVLSLIMLFVCIVMPLGFAWSLWRADEASLAGWLVTAAYAATLVFLIMAVGRWDIAGDYLRLAVLAMFVLALVLSFFRHRHRPLRAPDGRPIWRSHWPTILPLVVFLAGAIHVGLGMMAPTEARELTFPIKDGRYMVVHGGNSVLINYHQAHAPQAYAVDIVGLNAAGVRASGVHPQELGSYAIFGARVVAPCSGEVVEVADGLPDLAPPQADTENPAGNHVVVACNGLLVLLAHLHVGSVAVETGEAVRVGQALGAVGNSGNTTEPHLHIHAVLEGTGSVLTGEAVPILFDGRHPIRNAVFAR